MGLKDKLKAKSAGVREQVDAEMARMPSEKLNHPRTAIGQAGAFQVEISKSDARIRELEARVKELETTAIPSDDISPNPWQPRRVFDEAEIQKLAGSIAEIGLIQPVIVRSVGITNTSTDSLGSVGNTNTHHQIIAGERRWRACRTLGMASIKAIVLEATDEEMAAMALAENFDRTDLTAYEIALAIKNAETAFPNRKSLASCLGINRSDLYDYLAYFSLPPFVIDDLEVAPGLIGRAAAKELCVTLKKHGDRAVDAIRHLWPRVKSGEIDQGKIAGLIEASVTRGEHVRAERDIRKLFVGKEQAGSITRDTSGLTIKIRSAALTPDKENELRQYVEGMFKNGS